MSATFTESTLLDLVTDDGRSGFMVRLARHVDEGTAWVWLVTYGPQGVHGFIDDRLPCPPTRTSDNGSTATYAVTLPASHGTSARLRRDGAADAVSGGSCDIEVFGHHTDEVPRGPGSVTMQVRATFRPRASRAGSNLPGRTESIVDVDALVTVGGASRRLRGLGQFHEQVQDAPRFDTPFTYTSLRGEHVSLVGLRGPKAGRAVVHRDGEPSAHPGFGIDPLDLARPERSRSFRIDGPDASLPLLSGEVVPTVVYSVPIGGGRRPSAIVIGRIGDHAVTGFVNDWTP